jgi:hypothetical protein
MSDAGSESDANPEAEPRIEVMIRLNILWLLPPRWCGGKPFRFIVKPAVRGGSQPPWRETKTTVESLIVEERSLLPP